MTSSLRRRRGDLGACCAFALLLAFAAATAASAQTPTTPPPPAPNSTAFAATDTAAFPPARPADVASMDAIVKALYDVISGPPGQARDWRRFKSLFHPGARLIPTGVRPPAQGGGAGARVLTPDDYAQRAAPVLEKEGFFEREVARHTDTYGNITQLFSTYESRHAAADPQPFARGINSIQLFNDGKRWWVMTIYWDAERPDNPIPAQFRPKS